MIETEMMKTGATIKLRPFSFEQNTNKRLTHAPEV